MTLLPYLPIVAGYVIDDINTSNAFLSDFRKTLGDLVAYNHYAQFQEYAHKYNMGIQPESAGPHAGPMDGIKDYGFSDIVMSEFWSPSPHRPLPNNRFFFKQASSAAHIYGKKIVGPESFTTIGPHWNDELWHEQKSSFDHEIAAGLNRMYFHTFTASPPEMGLPGQEYFAGTHVNPQVTWWQQSGTFIDYMHRTQSVVQEGNFVADVLYYYGDHVPNVFPFKHSDPAGIGIHARKPALHMNVEELAPGTLTLSAAFRQAGYYTMCNGKIYHQLDDMAEQSWSEPPFSLVNGEKENNHLTFYDKESASYILEKNQRGPQYPFAVVNVIVTAIGGENSEKGANRFDEDVLTHKPDVLFIDYGLNDRRLALEKSYEAWSSMIQKAKSRQIKVILLTPSPDQRVNYDDPDNELKKQTDQIIRLAEENQVGLVDSYQAFEFLYPNKKKLKKYMSQVNHPNERGHELIANEMVKWFK